MEPSRPAPTSARITGPNLVNDRAALPVAAIVGDHLRHRWFVQQLADDQRFELRAVVCERQPPPAAADDPLVADHFRLRDEAELRHFERASPLDAHNVPVRVVGTGESNDPSVADWLRPAGADYLLLFGCGIIREPLLEDFTGRTINMHLGLSPYYKGHATNFWPLVNGEPECVGTTVHVATLAVDAGPILRQARPRIAVGDGSHDIGSKAVMAGARALRDAAAAYAKGEVSGEPQHGEGRIYRRSDFNPAAVAEMRRRFADGMIERYLDEREERDARFPIVE